MTANTTAVFKESIFYKPQQIHSRQRVKKCNSFLLCDKSQKNPGAQKFLSHWLECWFCSGVVLQIQIFEFLNVQWVELCPSFPLASTSPPPVCPNPNPCSPWLWSYWEIEPLRVWKRLLRLRHSGFNVISEYKDLWLCRKKKRRFEGKYKGRRSGEDGV